MAVAGMGVAQDKLVQAGNASAAQVKSIVPVVASIYKPIPAIVELVVKMMELEVSIGLTYVAIKFP